MKLLVIAALFLQAHMAPVLTYYDYNTHDVNFVYSGEIGYNPILDRIWMNACFLSDNPTGDDLVQIANHDTPGFIGDIVAQSSIIAPGFTVIGRPMLFDDVTNTLTVFTQSGGNAILVINATTAAVTRFAEFDYYTAYYNQFGAGAKKYYAFRASGLRIDTLNLATGVATLFTTTLPPGESFLYQSIAFSSASAGWMMGQDVTKDTLYKYDLTSGLITNSYTLPALWTGYWVIYSPIDNAVYVATAWDVAVVPDGSHQNRYLHKFDLGTLTFSEAWASAYVGAPGMGYGWPGSPDAAPILTYDPYRNLIWFMDGLATTFGIGTDLVAFDPVGQVEKYRFPAMFPANSQQPWKVKIAPDAVWISENNNDSFQQLARITFPASEPHLAVVKTPASGTFVQGGPVSFTIVVSNDGDEGSTATNVQLSDQLPTNGGLNWASASVITSQGLCSISGGSLLTCDFGDIIEGDPVTVTVSLASTPASACRLQSNTVVVTDEEDNTAEGSGSLNCTPLPLVTGNPGSSLLTWHKENTPTPWWPGAKVPDLDKMSLFKRLEKRVKGGENIDDAIAALKARGQPKPPEPPPVPKPPLKTHPELDKLMQSLLNKGRGIR